MKKDHVNLKNTTVWIRCNEDSRSGLWRDRFTQEHGGEFKKNGIYWQWFEKTEKPEKEVVAKQKQLYIFTDPDGREVITDNLSKFCRENKLNKSTVYLVMNGKRNHHKHFKCRKVED